MAKSELAQFKILQDDNRKFRHIVSKLFLDICALKEVISGKMVRVTSAFNQAGMSFNFHFRVISVRPEPLRTLGSVGRRTII